MNIVYFELNNWFSGRDYPDSEPFRSWIRNCVFDDDEWCKQNKLVVLAGCIDMSRNWCIAAPDGWVKENCPDLLTDKKSVYSTIMRTYDKENGEMVDIETEHQTSMSDFIRYPDDDTCGVVYGRFGWEFPRYCEENFGSHWYEEEDE